MLPVLYNNHYQIMQNADEVMIAVEMVHDVRHIRLNQAQHKPATVRLWMGDSIGHWEGDTLVVETTNFRRDQTFRGATQNQKGGRAVHPHFAAANPLPVRGGRPCGVHRAR
jgi:hypothetical protein